MAVSANCNEVATVQVVVSLVRAGQLEEGGVGNQRMCSARHPNVAQRALLNQALLMY